jgi:ribulose 1,5-bisphosphate synthetase/thiazole synthase
MGAAVSAALASKTLKVAGLLGLVLVMDYLKIDDLALKSAALGIAGLITGWHGVAPFVSPKS